MRARVLDDVSRLLREAAQIPEMIHSPSLSQAYYPAAPRKPKLRIAIDLLWWLLRHRELNTYYYVYGLDRRDVQTDQYLPYRRFRRIRNSRNYQGLPGADYNYVCLLRDKFVFSRMVGGVGLPTPLNFAIADRTSIAWLPGAPQYVANGPEGVPLEDLWRQTALDLEAFCKRLTGTMGKGAFPIAVRRGQVYAGDQAITVASLRDMLGTHTYLIQERLSQHPSLSKLHPESLNTIRLMTFNNSGTVEVFSAGLRIGTQGRPLDNWSAGGILVAIDLESGRLHGEGLYKPGYGGRTAVHPQSGTTFDGFAVPYFDDAVAAAVRLHRYFYGVHSIGWDIAITETGPVIVEGNDDWDGAVPMALEPGFKRRFLQMYR